MISKKFLVPAFVIALVGAGTVFKVSLTQAVSNNPHDGLVTYLSQKLGINQSKVQTAFDGYRTDKLTTFLNGLVKENKITEKQKTAILAKHLELQKTRETTDWANKTPAERKTAMEKQRADLESWAKSQGIDTSYLQFGLGSGMMGGRGGKGMGRGMMGGFNR